MPGMGKQYLDAIYLKLGQIEMDDMADGVKALWNRPYIDKDRVGIYGTSYGGYTSVMEILRHPEVFAAASSSSPPTDWRNYDTIYTERYMWIPQENKEGYDKGSAMTLRRTICKGRLMLYYGTADNNVHPSNMMQLIQALQRAGKSFEVQVGPDQGHSGVNTQRMMEFFIENLVIHPLRAGRPARLTGTLSMAAYVVVQVDVKDPARYEAYKTMVPPSTREIRRPVPRPRRQDAHHGRGLGAAAFRARRVSDGRTGESLVGVGGIRRSQGAAPGDGQLDADRR